MTQRRRILFIDHTARLGGGEIALCNLIFGLDRDRFEAVVLLFSPGPLLDRLTAAGVSTQVLPLDRMVAETRKESVGLGSLFRLFSLLRTLKFTRRVHAYIKQLRPDLVHTNSLKSDVIGGLAARWAGVPVIWHVRDRIAADYLSRASVPVFRWLAGRLPRFVIANSQATLDTLGKRVRGVAIASGVVVRPLASAAARPAGSLVVGLVGRLTRWKGQHVFIEAVHKLRPAYPHVHFQIIGSALFGEEEHERTLRETVRRYGLDDAIEFTGFREDVAAAIDGLDVLVHASITGEPFGQVILEAMVAGKPVVATRGGGVPEIVQDGVTGLLVPMGDAGAMADALAELLSDPARRADMGRRGRERAVACFSIGHTVGMVQDVYEQLLGPGGNT